MKTMIRNAAIAATIGALMSGGAFARAASALPSVQKYGPIEYLSGGVGKDEANAIEHASKRWPLTLEFAVKEKPRAEFAAGVKVVVRDASGNSVLEATSGGPFLLARLAPGHYEVDATLHGKTLHEKLAVVHGHPTKAMFLWPAGTGENRS